MTLTSPNMKTIYIIIIYSILSFVSSFAQETKQWTVYGNAGLGLSKVNYSDSEGGILALFGVTVKYDHWLLHYDRSINNEIELFKPEEKITSHAIFLGYSLQPFVSVPEIFLNGKFGIGTVENLSRGKIVSYALFNDQYEMKSEQSNSRIIEIDAELRIAKYVGFYWGILCNFNQLRNIYGTNVGIIVGDI